MQWSPFVRSSHCLRLYLSLLCCFWNHFWNHRCIWTWFFTFSYLSFSIFTVYNDDMLTEPIKKIPFLLYRDAHHNIRSPLKVNYAENAHTTLDHNESLITFRSRMHFPNTWRRMMMVGYLNACCKYTLLSLTFYLYLVVQKWLRLRLGSSRSLAWLGLA